MIVNNDDLNGVLVNIVDNIHIAADSQTCMCWPACPLSVAPTWVPETRRWRSVTGIKAICHQTGLKHLLFVCFYVQIHNYQKHTIHFWSLVYTYFTYYWLLAEGHFRFATNCICLWAAGENVVKEIPIWQSKWWKHLNPCNYSKFSFYCTHVWYPVLLLVWFNKCLM